MVRFVFVAIPRKPGTIDCDKFRTTTVMSQLTKLMLRVILNKIIKKIELEIVEEQCDFKQRIGTCNAIFISRMIAERTLEMQLDLYK